MAVLEVMPITHEIQSMIVESKSAPEIRELARQQGMRSLRENALGLAVQGLTTIEEVLTVTMDETVAIETTVGKTNERTQAHLSGTPTHETGLRPL